MNETDGFYDNGFVMVIGGIIAFVTFLAVWAAAIGSVGWVIGFVIGWIPAIIAATVAFYVWPLVLLLIVLAVLYLAS